MPGVTFDAGTEFPRPLVIPGVYSASVSQVCHRDHSCSIWLGVLVYRPGRYWRNDRQHGCPPTGEKIPIGFHFDWHIAQEYLRFGAPLLGSGVLVFLIFNLDNLLIGSILQSVDWATMRSPLHGEVLSAASSMAPSTAYCSPPSPQSRMTRLAMRRSSLETVDLVAFVFPDRQRNAAGKRTLLSCHFSRQRHREMGPGHIVLRDFVSLRNNPATTEPLANCIMALGRTRVLLQAAVLAGLTEVVLLALVVKSGKVELVAAVVLFAYVTQAVIYIPFLRRHLGIEARDIVAQLWPVIPALFAGYGATLIGACVASEVPWLPLR